MANYIGMCRTNYFTVTDTDKLMEIINNLTGDGEICVKEHDREKGKFMFYCCGDIEGYITDNRNTEDASDKMIVELQNILPDGEALILTEIGNEKMKYLLATATIVTNKAVERISLDNLALDRARNMLNNHEFITQADY